MRKSNEKTPKKIIRTVFFPKRRVEFFCSTNTGFRAFFYYIRAPGASEVLTNEY